MVNYEVRIAYAVDQASIPTLDPAKITSFQQGVLIRNLYSSLIEYDLHGDLQSGIASRFYWDGLHLIFEFDKKVQTKSGHYINAEDAAVSVRRVLKLGSATHTNLSHFIGDSKQSNNVFEDCDSVYVADGKLILKVKEEKHKPFVVSTLATSDFAIVPRSAIDTRSLAISDHTETSGPYFIDTIRDVWELRKNPEHFHLTSASPQKIKLVPVGLHGAAEVFLGNKVDIIPTGFNVPKIKIDEMGEQISDFEMFKTLPIKLYLVQFSLPALRKTTVNQRYYIASKFRRIMEDQYPLPILSEPTDEFFLENGHGQLSKAHQVELRELAAAVRPEPSSYRPTFYLYTQIKEAFSVFRQIEEITPVETSDLPANQPLEERMDVFVIATDTAYEEDLSLLGYNFNQGTFGYDAKDGEAWLAAYMGEEDKEKRAEMARNLQFDGLRNGVIFPMFKAPYTVLARNGFSIDISPIFATTHFWRIKKQ